MRWTQLQCDLLFSMRKDGKSRAEIAAAIGVSIGSADVKYNKLKSARAARAKLAAVGVVVSEGDVRPSGRRHARGKPSPRWSVEHNLYLIAETERSVPFETIGQAINRTRWACKVQYHALKSGRARGVAAKTPPAAAPAGRPTQPPTARLMHTSALVTDAELRSRIQSQGITAGLLGDPPPGRSALDQLRAGGVEQPQRIDYRTVKLGPKVTLATEPLR